MEFRSRLRTAALAVVVGLAVPGLRAAEKDRSPGSADPYARWTNGPGKDASQFPIAVWLQDPRNAPKYQAIGVNLYVGLWKGPTEQQIAELRRHGMAVICDQNDYALARLDEKTIVGWMHGDEPDNAQSLGQGKGYGPPIPPEKIVEDYRRIRARDATRPVLLNLGQGVAWDGWHGRGVRTNHPEDYPEYVRGGDIVSFDIYPVVHDKPAVSGRLWYVARGVRRLRDWAGPERITWNCIECTRISNLRATPTPEQVKAEVWMSLIHGSQGIIYFCHQFQPRFIEAALLADEEMARAVSAINRQVHGLAPVLRSPAVADAVSVSVSPAEVAEDMAKLLGPQGIAVSARKHEGKLYVFSVRMEASEAKGAFAVKGLTGETAVRVLGEDRTLRAKDGRFEDRFGPHAVHLYEMDVAGSQDDVSFVPEMEALPGMDAARHAHEWSDAEKARFAEDVRRANAEWKKRAAAVAGRVTPERARSLSRWAQTQMEDYKSVPSLEKVVLEPVGTDADQTRLVLEGTIDTLPTHHALVTRWLKVYVAYDLRNRAISEVTITIRGQLLE